MTRPSRRELEHLLDDLSDDAAGSDDAPPIRVEETVVGTAWSPEESDGDDVLGPGETRTETWDVAGGPNR